jgi:hypothetical protein
MEPLQECHEYRPDHMLLPPPQEAAVSTFLDESPEKTGGGARDVRIKMADRVACCLDDDGFLIVLDGADLEELEEAGRRAIDQFLCECCCDDVARIGEFAMALDDLCVGVKDRSVLVGNREDNLQKRRSGLAAATPQCGPDRRRENRNQLGRLRRLECAQQRLPEVLCDEIRPACRPRHLSAQLDLRRVAGFQELAGKSGQAGGHRLAVLARRRVDDLREDASDAREVRAV